MTRTQQNPNPFKELVPNAERGREKKPVRKGQTKPSVLPRIARSQSLDPSVKRLRQLLVVCCELSCDPSVPTLGVEDKKARGEPPHLVHRPSGFFLSIPCSKDLNPYSRDLNPCSRDLIPCIGRLSSLDSKLAQGFFLVGLGPGPFGFLNGV
uniref:Uncharacterized protein n=1 Tax=Cannabis sativa TaxID=3483 RepID=A0A803P153_CANSA